MISAIQYAYFVILQKLYALCIDVHTRSHLRAKRAQQCAIGDVCMVARPLLRSKGKAAFARPISLGREERRSSGWRLRWTLRGGVALALIAVLRLTGGDFALLGLILEDGEYPGADASGSAAAAASAAGPSGKPSAQREDDEL